MTAAFVFSRHVLDFADFIQVTFVTYGAVVTEETTGRKTNQGAISKVNDLVLLVTLHTVGTTFLPNASVMHGL